MKKTIAGWMGLSLLGCLVGVSAMAVDLAKVNERVITDKDLESALGGLNEVQRKNILKDRNSRREILMNLVDQEVVVQLGTKEKLDQTPEFKTAMENFRKQLLAQRLLNRDVDAKLTEDALKKYYKLHKNRFTTDQVHVQHILIEDEAQVQELLKKAKDSKNDFQVLAEQFSKDPSAKNNRGDLGFVNINSPFVSEFKDAVFSAPVGEVSEPVKTVFGYHILKVVEKKMGKTLGYDEVELRVKNELQRELRFNYVDKLKQQAKIQVFDAALEKM